MSNSQPIYILNDDVDLHQVIHPNVMYRFHLFSNFEIDSIYINSISSEHFSSICKTAIFDPLITYSFSNISETLYFIFVCQNLCSIIEIDDEQIFTKFLSSLEKVTLVPSKKKDINILQKYIENPKFLFLDEDEVLNSQFDAKELKRKYFLINELVFDEQLTLSRFLFLSLLTLFNFFLRRNYFPTSAFKDPSFLFPPRIQSQSKSGEKKKLPKLQDSDFLKIRIIGYGSHGVVSLAVHKTTGFLYAIKTIMNLKYYSAGLLCFEKNYHSRIIHCYGTISQGMNKAFVLDFMSNGSLKDKMITDPNLKSKIIYQILFALDYLHSFGLIHCDINPSSIVLNRDFDAYLTSFSHTRDYVSLDKKTISIGTLHFMAPEIITGSSQYSFQSDIYSLGVLIYEFTTGKKPYEKLTLLEAMKRGAVGDIDRLRVTEGPITKLYDYCTSSKEGSRSTSFILRRMFESEQLFYANADEDVVIEFIEKVKKQQLIDEETCDEEILVNSDKRNDFIFIINEANDGNPNAQYNLGLMYQNGWIVNQNDQIAFEWFLKSANQNYSLSLLEVGLVYHKKADKVKIPFDYQKAFEMYKKAAEQDLSDALNGIGELYLEGHLPEGEENLNFINEAYKYFLKASDKGNHMSQCNLGKLFLSGKIGDVNIEKSLEYFNLAASQGNPEAEVSLAKIYSEGKFVPKDDALAARFYKKASYHKRPDAMIEYGKMLLEGRGVNVNVNEGHMWIKKAEDLKL